MYTGIALILSAPFFLWGVWAQFVGGAWFRSLKKPASYPGLDTLQVIYVAYVSFSATALIVANIDAANALGAWLFIALEAICAGISTYGFIYKQILAATIITGVYYSFQLGLIVVYARTSAFSALLTAICSLWTLYTIYAGFRMYLDNRPRAVTDAR